MPSSKVIQLRQALSEKFPGLRMHFGENRFANRQLPEDTPHAGELLENSLCRSALNEVVAADGVLGSALLIREMIRRTTAHHQIIALVDGCDCFDVTEPDGADLTQLLWVRCSDAEQALRAADLLLRDSNLPTVILDLKLNPEAQLRRIPSTTWYRFQRLVEITCASCLVFTPRAMVAPAKTRMVLDSNFSLPDLERGPDELLRQLKMDPARTHRFHAGDQKIA